MNVYDEKLSRVLTQEAVATDGEVETMIKLTLFSPTSPPPPLLLLGAVNLHLN